MMMAISAGSGSGSEFLKAGLPEVGTLLFADSGLTILDDIVLGFLFIALLQSAGMLVSRQSTKVALRISGAVLFTICIQIFLYALAFRWQGWDSQPIIVTLQSDGTQFFIAVTAFVATLLAQMDNAKERSFQAVRVLKNELKNDTGNASKKCRASFGKTVIASHNANPRLGLGTGRPGPRLGFGFSRRILNAPVELTETLEPATAATNPVSEFPDRIGEENTEFGTLPDITPARLAQIRFSSRSSGRLHPPYSPRAQHGQSQARENESRERNESQDGGTYQQYH